jgi:TonB family protein
MTPVAAADVYTPDELARAAGAPRAAVRRLIAEGRIPLIPGTQFIAGATAVRAGAVLRGGLGWASTADFPRPSLFESTLRTSSATTHAPAIASVGIHLIAVLALALSFRGAAASPGATEVEPSPARLVFVVSPGPGGGGGGGGLRQPAPARRLERTGSTREAVSVPPVEESRPAPSPEPPPPLPSHPLVAPVATVAADTQDTTGRIDAPKTATNSQGPGTSGGAGTGPGTGSGAGTGNGIDQGSGGGIGGGPYRPGSGIEPPRLLREVKAGYTEEARRRNVTGEVLLEIVVRRDGSVGDVTLLRGLGYGLDDRAVAAVRQWRFDPARRMGTPVDVIVEVGVDFSLR